MKNKKMNPSDENSREQMASTIVKNISAQRRESSFENSVGIDKNVESFNQIKGLKEDDFIKKPVSKIKMVLLGLLSLVLSFVLVFYFYGMFKLNDRFLPNTYVNNGNVGSMTKGEAVNLFKSLQRDIIPEEITVKKQGGKIVRISTEKIGYSDNIEKSVDKIYKKQNHFLWFTNYFCSDVYDLPVEYSFDYNKIEDECIRKIIDASLDDSPQNAAIERNGDKFVVVKEEPGSKIDTSKEKVLLDYVKSEILNGNMEIDISGIDCYEKPTVISDDLENVCAKLNKLKDCKFTFDFNYTKEVLEGKDILSWINTTFSNKEEPFDVNYESAMEYVENLAKKYDTYGNDRTFNSTSRGTMLLKQGKGCYGWWIDQEKTCSALINAIKSIKSANLKPVYYVSSKSGYGYVCKPEWRTAKSDMSNTYLEVDLSKQHLWYYFKGKKIFECDVVSGNQDKTSAGVYRLWQKVKDKTADGKNAKYWINVGSETLGIYDDESQKKLGGDTYKQSGTSGGIKVPLKVSKYIYEKIPVGTPCVMYW